MTAQEYGPRPRDREGRHWLEASARKGRKTAQERGRQRPRQIPTPRHGARGSGIAASNLGGTTKLCGYRPKTGRTAAFLMPSENVSREVFALKRPVSHIHAHYRIKICFPIYPANLCRVFIFRNILWFLCKQQRIFFYLSTLHEYVYFCRFYGICNYKSTSGFL